MTRSILVGPHSAHRFYGGQAGFVFLVNGNGSAATVGAISLSRFGRESAIATWHPTGFYGEFSFTVARGQFMASNDGGARFHVRRPGKAKSLVGAMVPSESFPTFRWRHGTQPETWAATRVFRTGGSQGYVSSAQLKEGFARAYQNMPHLHRMWRL